MSPKFAAFLLKKMGWTWDDPIIPEKHAVILAVPHTSIWDFLVGYLYYRAVGGYLRTMIKKEAFFFPLNLLLRAMGAFPVDRANPTSLVKSLIDEMKKSDTFHLVLCPEGTRKAVRKWKTGYHVIARETGAPVYLAYFDWGRHYVGRGKRFELSPEAYTHPENINAIARADTDRVQAEYEKLGLAGLHPEGYTTK